jgi:hypothetical protein
MSLKIAQKEEGAIVGDTHSARHCSVSRRFDIKQVFLDLRVRVLEWAIHLPGVSQSIEINDSVVQGYDDAII